MLKVADISVRAGGFSLSDISLEVQPSSCHVLLGPTGSGKTLLLESIIGLRNPDKGNIFLDGSDITGCPAERRGLAYVPQDLALFPHLTVRENIFYPLRIRGCKQPAENAIVRELVESLAIRHVLDRAVSNLSGGERQRTALARAVASGCKTLVLDEPLSALHQSLKRELWFLLKDIQKRYDLAILMVTHDLNEAFFLGDRISIIIDGKLHQQGAKGTVYGHPNSRAVAKFLGITNLFQATAQGVTGDSLSVGCAELGLRLKLSGLSGRSAKARASCSVVGIRSEDVKLLIPGGSFSSITNIVAGTIRDVYEHENSSTIMALCGPQATTLEAVVPRSLSRKFSFSKGQSLTFQLPEEDLFLIPGAPLQ
jgi:ABC-type sugar transport system ATPase subunit